MKDFRSNNIVGSTIVIGGKVDGDVTNKYSSSPAITPQMWDQLLVLVEKHGKVKEVEQLQELQLLLGSNRISEARPVWLRLKGFLSSFANVAQIISTIDALTKS